MNQKEWIIDYGQKKENESKMFSQGRCHYCKFAKNHVWYFEYPKNEYGEIKTIHSKNETLVCKAREHLTSCQAIWDCKSYKQKGKN